MVTLTSAEDALKTLYLGVVAEQLNTSVNPLLAKISKTSQDVWGKEVVKLAPYGINGGVGAGTEAGALPTAAGNNYVKFTATLKNLYGTIEISDKAVRASENSAGAFVNLLNAEMEGLIKASKYNLGRMLYGDGSGQLGVVNFHDDNSRQTFAVTNCFRFIEGQMIDVYSADGSSKIGSGKRITSVDRVNETITLDSALDASPEESCAIYVQNSKDNEIIGLKGIINNPVLYGLTRANYNWMKPYQNAKSGQNLSIEDFQEAIDYIDDLTGAQVNFIATTHKVRRLYLALMDTNRRNIDYMELDGGFKSLSYNGIPLVVDKFVEPGHCYFLNTDDFNMHQLCDWRWLESENGKIIRQKPGLPVYTATLVKYAELICDRPAAIGDISNITV